MNSLFIEYIDFSNHIHFSSINVLYKYLKKKTIGISNDVFFFTDGNVEAMSSTPQRGFGTAAWNKLQRDLNSPSASCRVRAIRAMK